MPAARSIDVVGFCGVNVADASATLLAIPVTSALSSRNSRSGTVRWGRADLSDVEIGNLDPYRLEVSLNGEVTIPVDYEARLSGKTGTVTNYLYADADLTRTPLVIDFG